MGSVLGLTLALRQVGVSAVPVLADDADPPATYSFLPGFSLLTRVAEIEQPDAFVACDSPNFERLGLAADMAKAAEALIVLDHHPDNTGFGHVDIVDSSAASTAQLVWRLCEPLGVTVTPEIALCCYTGLLTDTGGFRYDNTTPVALRDAAEMLDAGVVAAEAARLVYQERSGTSLALEARVMSHLTVANAGLVAYAWIDDADFTATGASPEDAEHLPDAIRRLGGIEVAMLLRIVDGQVRGNLRAKSGFDVGSVARGFGGGGHAAAAGFTFDGGLQDLLAEILDMLPGAGRG